MITENEIIKGAQFKVHSDTIEIIEVLPNYYEDLTGVKTTVNGRGDSTGVPFCDELTDLLDFINEQ